MDTLQEGNVLPGDQPKRYPRTLREVSDRCEAFASEHGYPYYMFVLRVPVSMREPLQFALSNFPRAWLERYDRCEYINIDPIARRILHTTKPFVWNRLPKDDPQVALMFAEAESHGLAAGMTVPLHGPNGKHAAFILAGASTPETSATQDQQFGSAWLFAVRTLDILTRIALDEKAPQIRGRLTARQKEILILITEGRSVKEIARTLSVHLRTVEHHLTMAKEKMGAETREQAIVTALTIGELQPPAYPPTLDVPTDLT